MSEVPLEQIARAVGGAIMQRVVMDDGAAVPIGLATIRALQKSLIADPTSDDPAARERSADPGTVKEHGDLWIGLWRKSRAGKPAPATTPASLGAAAMVTGAGGAGDQWTPGESAKTLYQALTSSIQAGTNPALADGVGENLTAAFVSLLRVVKERGQA